MSPQVRPQEPSEGIAVSDEPRISALVEAARSGSADAFGELVDRYRAPVVRLAYSLTRDPDEAKDIAQDAFLRAFRRMQSFQPDRPFSRWLFVIARNVSLDAIRRKRRSLSTPTLAPVPELGPEDWAMRNDDAHRLREAMEGLPEHYRTVLDLYYTAGLRYREIAEALGIPIGTVKTYITRAKRRLRDELWSEEMQAAA
ncbi:MAG: sigma-70 family RNA polymerase sigma factor [Candidatus Eremiobacteraeota bacterium]|nr:sigma-70 family RNA polymerase sigma factor [Candidatus Eremiobacteraeota bacterium]MBV9647431.1 sigma-70 family RNA polymerase sigma factor [Candidatus Eremiobacteraeota bacterium]